MKMYTRQEDQNTALHYRATFAPPADASEADADWIGTNNDDSQWELVEVTDLCATHRCTADLYLDNGERAGWVHADGSYRLVRPGHASNLGNRS